MRKLLYIPVVLLTAVACSKTEPAAEEGQPRICFDLGFAGQTKATASAFESGDVTGLYMTEYNAAGNPTPLQISGNAVNNAALRFDGSVWSTSPALYWDKDVKYDVYGYYPYTDPESVDECRFSVATDQSTKKSSGSLGGYEASDFLWARQTGVSYPDVVKLSFTHRMSRLVVNLVKGEDYEGVIPDDAVVIVHGTVKDALVDIGTGDVVKDPYGSSATIKMNRDSETQFSAIIVPQRLENRRPLIEVITKDVSYLMESRFVFRSGVQHTINVMMANAPDKVKIEIGGEIQGWN